MHLDSKKASKVLSINRIWIPVLVGMMVPVYLFYTHRSYFSVENFQGLKIFPLCISVVLICIRDFAFIYRLRILTQRQIGWLKSFYIVTLWDFSSAVTPSVVGGGVVAIYLLVKEGVKFANALACIMLIAIIDNCFFMVISPLGLLGISYHNTAAVILASGFVSGLKAIFGLGMLIVFAYTSIVMYSLFFNPHFLKLLLVKVCMKFNFLKKWKRAAIGHGNDLIIASAALKNQTKSYWFGVIALTSLGISCRYAVLNSLMCMCTDMDITKHFLVLGNQIILWIVMLVSPTPGSAGTAEMCFSALFENLLGDKLIVIEMLWRFLTYYIHIAVGAIVLSKWLKKPARSYS